MLEKVKWIGGRSTLRRGFVLCRHSSRIVTACRLCSIVRHKPELTDSDWDHSVFLTFWRTGEFSLATFFALQSDFSQATAPTPAARPLAKQAVKR